MEDWEKNAALFLLSQSVSLFGSMLVQYAIMWYITLETRSGIMMTISILCGLVPVFFISPFAGVWADQYPRKRLIIAADLLIAGTTLVMVVVFYTGRDAVWMLFAALAIRALGTGIQTPAMTAMIPQLVPADKLTKINGINGTLQAMVSLASPMISAALLSLATMESIFLIDVFTALLAVGILLLMKVKPHDKALRKEKVRYLSDMKDGLTYISHHGYIRTIFIFCAVYYVLVSPLAFLTPLQVTRSFGGDVWRLSALEIAFSLGMMLGGVLIAAWGGFKNKAQTMVTSILTNGVCTMALGLVSSFWIYLALIALVGILMPVFYTPFMVLLQQKVEEDFQGRVFGVFNMISSSMMPLAMLLFGPLADVVDIEPLLVVTGGLLVIEGIFMSRNAILLEAGRPE
jgi:DHA3 family macrolide efflux protein-like MFS transporter